MRCAPGGGRAEDTTEAQVKARQLELAKLPGAYGGTVGGAREGCGDRAVGGARRSAGRDRQQLGVGASRIARVRRRMRARAEADRDRLVHGAGPRRDRAAGSGTGAGPDCSSAGPKHRPVPSLERARARGRAPAPWPLTRAWSARVPRERRACPRMEAAHASLKTRSAEQCDFSGGPLRADVIVSRPARGVRGVGRPVGDVRVCRSGEPGVGCTVSGTRWFATNAAFTAYLREQRPAVAAAGGPFHIHL